MKCSQFIAYIYIVERTKIKPRSKKTHERQLINLLQKNPWKDENDKRDKRDEDTGKVSKIQRCM